jgi:hypothetical protein
MTKTQFVIHALVAIGCICILPFMLVYWSFSARNGEEA